MYCNSLPRSISSSSVGLNISLLCQSSFFKCDFSCAAKLLDCVNRFPQSYNQTLKATQVWFQACMRSYVGSKVEVERELLITYFALIRSFTLFNKHYERVDVVWVSTYRETSCRSCPFHIWTYNSTCFSPCTSKCSLNIDWYWNVLPQSSNRHIYDLFFGTISTGCTFSTLLHFSSFSVTFYFTPNPSSQPVVFVKLKYIRHPHPPVTPIFLHFRAWHWYWWWVGHFHIWFCCFWLVCVLIWTRMLFNMLFYGFVCFFLALLFNFLDFLCFP